MLFVDASPRDAQAGVNLLVVLAEDKFVLRVGSRATRSVEERRNITPFITRAEEERYPRLPRKLEKWCIMVHNA